MLKARFRRRIFHAPTSLTRSATDLDIGLNCGVPKYGDTIGNYMELQC